MKTLMVRLAKKSGPLEEDGGDEGLSWHKAVAKSIKVLDRLAKDSSLPSLTSFVSEDPENVYDAVDDEDEAEEILAKLPPVKWHEPNAAMPTVDRLIELIEAGDGLGEIKSPAKILSELQDLKTVLQFAIKKKAKFRFYEEF